jgi:subtilisin family serine protease
MKYRAWIVLAVLLVSAWMLTPAVSTQGNGRGGRLRERYDGREVAGREVLVRFKPGTPQDRAETYRQADADEDEAVGQGEWRRIHSRSRDVQALVQALLQRPDVLEVQPNHVLHSTRLPDDPQFSSLWGLKNTLHPGSDIHATQAWDISTGSTSTVVAVVDSGIDATHPDLVANLWSAPAAFTVTVAGRAVSCPAGSHGFNALAFTCSPNDDNSHGTHVSGTIGATGNNGLGVTGVNWTTRIMGLKFLDSTGSGTESDAINAIDFAIQTKNFFAQNKGANVRVLSNSYGGDGFSSAFTNLITRANAAEMLFVAAAGNANSNNDAAPFYPASYTNSNVLAVASSGGSDERSGFSNYGATSVDLAAPGESILSTLPGGGYDYKSGTSMATPQVAGAAALVLSGCNLNTAQLKATLLNTADSAAGFAGLTVTGGRLNVDSALRSCATLPTTALTSPAEGADFAAPASISLEASASDPDGIARVEFYAGSTLIGTSTTSPFGGTWSNVATGSYTLTAKAFDILGLATVSTPVHVTVGGGTGGGGGGGIGTSATFVGTDTTTQGNWRGVYGADGYQIVNETRALPAYATVTTNGAASYTWAPSTADARALQKAVGSDRIASTWYGDTFTIDVNVTDGSAHPLALYLLDWDPAGRVETIEVRDAESNAVLDTRAANGFAGGQYWRWTVSGHVIVRVTRVGGPNAVMSGVFFGGAAAANSGPTVALTSPTEGAAYTAPATVAFSATANDADGISRVEFYQGATLVATSVNTTNPYTATWANVAAGSYTLTAKAYDGQGAATVSSPVHVTVGGGGGGIATSAAFLGTDTTTKGSWRGVYGGDGYQIVNETNALPAYAAVTTSGAAGYTWAASTSDTRALQKAAGPDRIASTWYGETFTIDVNITDGAAHPVGLYLLDWDPANRAETVEVRDANSNAVLDTRSASGFAGGQYWRWTVSGHVVIRVTRTGPLNAVVSGVFFGAASAGNSGPTVGLTSPTEGSSYIAPAAIPLSADASDADGISKVEFYQGATLVASKTGAPYTATWASVPAGSYTLTAKAYDGQGAATVSAPVHVTVSGGGGGGVGTSATFAGTDITTKGSWLGVYGADGYQIVNEATALPTYATVTTSGAASYTWAGSTSDTRALQNAGGTDRIASTWYGDTFTIDVNVTAGAAHEFALYLLDWDPANRAETLEVRDADSNVVLDTRTASGFTGGQYWRWTVSGHIVVRVTRAGGVNAVTSGLFFGR